MIQDRFQHLLQDIEQICVRCGRDPAEITVLAATKYVGVEAMNEAVVAGIKVIGENRVQDAQRKFSSLAPVKRHFIGHLQSNKVKVAVKLFDLIESVDGLAIAEKIENECAKINKVMPILVEVNVAADQAKHGISPDQVLNLLGTLKKFQHLNLRGLMTIVPYADDPEKVRPFFRQMKKLCEVHRQYFGAQPILSMGMSHDYGVAIEDGSTEVRIGSLLFGEKGV